MTDGKMRDEYSKGCLRQSEHMKRSWLEVGSHEEVPCVPLCGLTATCMSSGLQLVCRTVWAHPLVESTAVSTALDRCRISTHTWPPPLQDGQLSLKVAPEVVLDTLSHHLLSLPKGPGRFDSVSIPYAEHRVSSDSYGRLRVGQFRSALLCPLHPYRHSCHCINVREAQICAGGGASRWDREEPLICAF